MRCDLLIALLACWGCCAGAALAQETVASTAVPVRSAPSGSAVTWLQLLAGEQTAGAAGRFPSSSPASPPSDLTPLAVGDTDPRIRTLAKAREELAKAQDAKEVERLQKQIELLQQQIDLLRLRSASLAVNTRQAAERDQELANAVDDLREQTDADRRWGPRLPSPLKELFLPSHTNETPLSIYGVFSFGYNHENGVPGKPGGFYFGEFSPQFLLMLNDKFLLEGEISVGPKGSVDVSRAQIDWLATDWLTMVAGRFESPIGFFNERLNHPWINKLPDPPLMFRQVSPGDLSLIGVQARGAFYLGCLPVKMEYAFFASNGLQTKVAAPGLNDVANLQGLENTYDTVTNDLALGGRVGFWAPEIGLMGGVSYLHNGDYLPQNENQINLWALDLGWHKGNWDLRSEYAEVWQQASFLTDSIHRWGMYAQVAYRPLHAECEYIRNTELVFRYSCARFKGIDPTALDLTAFDSKVDVPVGRNQYTVGINHYFYPSLVLKLAYQFNRELGGIQLHDNVLMAQLSWGF
jgi:hypothetical protein